MISKKTGIVVLVGITMLMIVVGLLLKPIPQPQDYHHFIDQRTWLHITNAQNVLSNIPFAIVGIWGLFLLFSPGKVQFIDDRERWPWIVVSIGLILTALGSSYYHLLPNNARLVWDRLPMTIVFTSFIAALISERINMRLGLWLWPVLLGIGIYSVFHWYATELLGRGDLRLYAAVQVYAIVVALVMLLIPSRYTRAWDLAIVAAFFVLAKLLETFDREIYGFTHSIVSGHTLKHLAAAAAGLWLLRMLWKRRYKIFIRNSPI